MKISKLARRDFLLRAGGALAVPLLARPCVVPALPAEQTAKGFRGIFAILQTPFTLGDQMDEEDLERELNFCVKARAQGVVWPQLYGEFNVLSEAERLRGAEILLRTPRGGAAAVIGVQAPDRETAVRLARHAEAKGADAVISLPPYHRSVTLDAVADYYRSIAGAVRLPVLARGSSGTMPACEFVDVDVRIYNLAAAGEMAEARALFEKLLPMINLEETYGIGFAKAVLVRRGIFKTAKRRGIPELKVLDSADEQEMEGWWRDLVPYLTV
ncbi:MAG: hypothetical protein DMG22_00940 [Acidobacteria bacterium]|nr:MAG: hypothetical protein DMG22_00940 [Acidobacteriota bacterium]